MEFCSEEYLNKVMEISNNDEKFVKAASDQNTTYTYIIEPEPDKGIKEKIVIGYKIQNGKIVEIWRGERETEFTVSGKYGVWVDLLTGKLGVTKAILTRKLKTKGDKVKLLKYSKAAKRWVEILRGIPTEFHGEYASRSIK